MCRSWSFLQGRGWWAVAAVLLQPEGLARGLSWGALPLACVFPTGRGDTAASPVLQTSEQVHCKRWGGHRGRPVGLWWGPVCEGGGPAPRGAGAAFQSGSVISHCQKVCAAFTFSHALKQLCYEKFQTYAEVETTAQRSQDTYPPRSMSPSCCCGGLIWLLFLFLLLCCSISKQVSDITAFPLLCFSMWSKKKKNLLLF